MVRQRRWAMMLELTADCCVLRAIVRTALLQCDEWELSGTTYILALVIILDQISRIMIYDVRVPRG